MKLNTSKAIIYFTFLLFYYLPTFCFLWWLLISEKCLIGFLIKNNPLNSHSSFLFSLQYKNVKINWIKNIVWFYRIFNIYIRPTLVYEIYVNTRALCCFPMYMTFEFWWFTLCWMFRLESILFLCFWLFLGNITVESLSTIHTPKSSRLRLEGNLICLDP